MALAIHERDERLHRQTHEKLMRSDRLAMIGQLAAGVAHEINNPLGSILLFSRLTMQQMPATGTGQGKPGAHREGNQALPRDRQESAGFRARAEAIGGIGRRQSTARRNAEAV